MWRYQWGEIIIYLPYSGSRASKSPPSLADWKNRPPCRRRSTTAQVSWGSNAKKPPPFLDLFQPLDDRRLYTRCLEGLKLKRNRHQGIFVWGVGPIFVRRGTTFPPGGAVNDRHVTGGIISPRQIFLGCEKILVHGVRWRHQTEWFAKDKKHSLSFPCQKMLLQVSCPCTPWDPLELRWGT